MTSASPTDEELVTRAQAELPYRTAAFAELVARHERKVYATAVQYLGNRADAEDVSQEVFLRVYRALPRFEQRSAFSTWLFRIVQNVCATRYGRRKRGQEREDSLAHKGAPTSHDPRPDLLDRLDGGDATVAVALDALGQTDRELLVLRFVSELSVHEVAATLGLKESAAKMRLKRAKERFAHALAAARAGSEQV